MNIIEQYRELQSSLIKKICTISDTKELLPHVVYIEEGNDGYPVYNRYIMETLCTEKATCVLTSVSTGAQNEYMLSELLSDWLCIIWTRYLDLHPDINKKENTESPKLWAFIYPFERLPRNASEQDIIKDYEKEYDELPTEKLTPDELAGKLNDECYNDQEYYTRFIICR